MPATRAKPPQQRVRYAVVGLGWIAQDAVLPAFAHAGDTSELVALVSDDPVKLDVLGRKHGVTGLYSYDEYDDCLGSGDVDAVYIALPNDMHREYVMRAARAGVHVLCEKPLGVTVRDCQAMIRACDEAGVKLMTAYRLHFDRANMEAVRIAREEIGEARILSADFTMPVKGDNIRLDAEHGGGTLHDIGIYCINAARYVFRAEPVEAAAWAASRDIERFSEVAEMNVCLLRFPGDRLAHFACSFGASSVSSWRVLGTKGDIRVEPGFSHGRPLEHWLTIEGTTEHRVFPHRDQFAPELDHFSECVLHDRQPEPSGMEGLIDVAIIEALAWSARSGRSVKLDLPAPERRPTLRQVPDVTKPAPPKKRRFVHASKPAG